MITVPAGGGIFCVVEFVGRVFSFPHPALDAGSCCGFRRERGDTALPRYDGKIPFAGEGVRHSMPRGRVAARMRHI